MDSEVLERLRRIEQAVEMIDARVQVLLDPDISPMAVARDIISSALVDVGSELDPEEFMKTVNYMAMGGDMLEPTAGKRIAEAIRALAATGSLSRSSVIEAVRAEKQ